MKVCKLVNFWYSVKFINPRKPERASNWKIQDGMNGYNRVPVQSISDDWSFSLLRLTAAPPERFGLAQTNLITSCHYKMNNEAPANQQADNR